jgi:hypothetical protein
MAGVVALSGCGAGPGGGNHPCTLIGAVSGGTIALDDLPAALRTGRATACLDQTCTTKDLDASMSVLFVQDDSLTSARMVTVHLTIIDAVIGKVLFDDQLSAPARVVTPNGPSCPPTAYQIGVRARADGSLQLTT